MKKSGLLLAAAVGALFATASFAAEDNKKDEANIKCVGGNACKGQGACKTATSSCNGQNKCKGTSWVMVKSEKECKEKGGKVEKDADKKAESTDKKAEGTDKKAESTDKKDHSES